MWIASIELDKKYYSWYSILNVCGWAVLERGFFLLHMWISFLQGFWLSLKEMLL